ncbi:hypothetical protein LCGC14_2232910, partial [marine sediment metagenome]
FLGSASPGWTSFQTEGNAGAGAGVHSRPPTEPTSALSPDYSVQRQGKTLLSPLQPDQVNETILADLAIVRATWETEEEIRMVLEQMITVEQTLTADNADFLSGSQLDQPGVPGVYTIWAASTVGDTEISVTLGGRTLVSGATVVLRANSEIRENEDTFFQMLSVTGGRPVINVNVVTAAVVRVRVKFIPAMAQ